MWFSKNDLSQCSTFHVYRAAIVCLSKLIFDNLAATRIFTLQIMVKLFEMFYLGNVRIFAELHFRKVHALKAYYVGDEKWNF